MKILAALTSILVLSACGPTYGDEYVVHIHPDFGSKTEIILDSMNKWNKAVGVYLTPIVEYPVHCHDPGNICMYISNLDGLNKINGYADPDGFWTGLTHRYSNDYSSIYILDLMLMDYSDPVAEQGVTYGITRTITHEFGHALGLDHDPHVGTVMCKSVGCQGPDITCLDKQQYFSLRGVDFYCN